MNRLLRITLLGALTLLGLSACTSASTPATSAANVQTPFVVDVGSTMTGAATKLSAIGAQHLKPLSVSASIDPATAAHIETDPVVTLNFSNGESFTYRNIAGISVYDGDTAFALSPELAEMAAAYQTRINQQSLSPRAAGSLSPQSTIGRRGYICLFQFIWCWAGFDNVPAWPDRTIHYRIAPNIKPQDVQRIQNAVAQWNTSTHGLPTWRAEDANTPAGATVTTFEELPRYIGPLDVGGVLSGLSPIGWTQQQFLPHIFIVEDFYTNAVLLHEMGHASGLNHEHQRCDRDTYITVNVDVWQRLFNFANWNTFCQWGEDSGRFDYDSIMLYRRGATSPRYTGPENNQYRGNSQTDPLGAYQKAPDQLSQGDIQDGLETLYLPRPTPTPPAPPAPPPGSPNDPQPEPRDPPDRG